MNPPLAPDRRLVLANCGATEMERNRTTFLSRMSSLHCPINAFGRILGCRLDLVKIELDTGPHANEKSVA